MSGQELRLTTTQIDRLRFMLVSYLTGALGTVVSSDTVHDGLIKANEQLPEFDAQIRNMTDK
ncbi:hypothetical protein [Roseibium sp. TrichSKD4]|uniref:hypothetical protein n=1 Tax=Roseibium sp. TrichSKD4 TaxID=744980 RepID=UPI0005905898|nr:hypothetical protein [Roseibium sp. TrichSKD4]